MSSVSLLIQAGLVGVILWAGLRLAQSRKGRSLPLPPGPKPRPLVGNLADLPPNGAREWEHWLKHKDLYGRLPIHPSETLAGFCLTWPSD